MIFVKVAHMGWIDAYIVVFIENEPQDRRLIVFVLLS